MLTVAVLLSENGAGETLGRITWVGLLFGTLLGSAVTIGCRLLKTSGDSTSVIASLPVDGVGVAEGLESGLPENDSDGKPGIGVVPRGVELSFGGRSWLEEGGAALGLVLGEVVAAEGFLFGEVEGLWSLLELGGETGVGDIEFGSMLA